MSICISCLISVFLYTSHAVGESHPECQAWSNIENYAKEKLDIDLCTRNNDCSGLNCSGSMMEKTFHVGIKIENCENPAKIKLFANVPQLRIHDWMQSFTHGGKFKISDDVGGQITLQKGNERFVIGLKLKFFENNRKYFPITSGGSFERNILDDAVVPVPSCNGSNFLAGITLPPEQTVALGKTTESPMHKKYEGKKPKRECVITRVSCRLHEMCLQVDKANPDGVCVCIPTFTRNSQGLCIYSPETSTDSGTFPYHGSPDSTSSGHAFLIPLLVTVAVVLVVASLVYAAIRLRFFQYLRRHLRVRVYEQVLLGQPEDNDEPLTDPVA